MFLKVAGEKYAHLVIDESLHTPKHPISAFIARFISKTISKLIKMAIKRTLHLFFSFCSIHVTPINKLAALFRVTDTLLHGHTVNEF